MTAVRRESIRASEKPFGRAPSPAADPAVNDHAARTRTDLVLPAGRACISEVPADAARAGTDESLMLRNF